VALLGNLGEDDRTRSILVAEGALPVLHALLEVCDVTTW
jgi:hypothetical protein